MNLDIVEIMKELGLPVAFLMVMIGIYNRSQERSEKERKELLDEHRTERKDWKESQQNLQTETNRVISELAQAIRDSNKNHP